MRTAILALTVAGLLTVTGLGIGLSASEGGLDALRLSAHPAGADEASMHGGMAGDHDHEEPGMERVRWPAAEGSVPTSPSGLPDIHHIRILEDAEFHPDNGVRSGNGTVDDPYVISGWHVEGDLYLADTDACFVVRENHISGQLTLNWNGPCVWVHHNHIRDLRVNENVKRTGYATGGLLERNGIEFLGQLRHYDGEFRHNVVGPFVSGFTPFDEVLETVPLPWTQEFRVANIDGFNQGLLHHNTFYGSVDLDLHGHHHGTGFFAPHSHYHGSGDRGMEHDHTDRWTSVSFTDNLIVDEKGYGLRYDDQNHAGDDRTASSEDNEQLDEDHRHHTRVEIARNTIEGAGIWIDVFNAHDRNHHTRNPGWLEVVDNQVALVERDPGMLPFIRFQYVPDAAIQVRAVKELEGNISGNTATWEALEERDPVEQFLDGLWGGAEPAMVRIDGVRDGRLQITGNEGDGFLYGVWARSMDNATSWSVAGNTFHGALQDIWYDDSVQNRPEGEQ